MEQKKRKLETTSAGTFGASVEELVVTSVATETALSSLKQDHAKSDAEDVAQKHTSYFINKDGAIGAVQFDPRILVEELEGGCERITRYSNGFPFERGEWNALGQRHGTTTLYSANDLQQTLWRSEYCNGVLHGRVTAYKQSICATLQVLNLGPILIEALTERLGAYTDIRVDGTWKAGFPVHAVVYISPQERWEVDYSMNKMESLKVFQGTRKTYELGFLNDRLEGTCVFPPLREEHFVALQLPSLLYKKLEKDCKAQPMLADMVNGHIVRLDNSDDGFSMRWSSEDQSAPIMSLTDIFAMKFLRNSAPIQIDLNSMMLPVLKCIYKSDTYVDYFVKRATILADKVEMFNDEIDLTMTADLVRTDTHFEMQHVKVEMINFNDSTVTVWIQDFSNNTCLLEKVQIADTTIVWKDADGSTAAHLSVTCAQWPEGSELRIQCSKREAWVMRCPQDISEFSDMPCLSDSMDGVLTMHGKVHWQGLVHALICDTATGDAEITGFGTLHEDGKPPSAGTVCIYDKLSTVLWKGRQAWVPWSYDKLPSNQSPFVVALSEFTEGDREYIQFPSDTTHALRLPINSNRLNMINGPNVMTRPHTLTWLLSSVAHTIRVSSEDRKKLQWVDLVSQESISDKSSTMLLMHWSKHKLQQLADEKRLHEIHPMIISYASMASYLQNSGVDPSNGSQPMLHFTAIKLQTV